MTQQELLRPTELLVDGVDGDRPEDEAGTDSAFQVHLEVFSGPFDLLLSLIAKHKLDVTEVALSQVTDEFIAYISASEAAWDLDETSEFLVVAATLLDLKAARLLPRGEVEDEEDLALLEARDLLFARLLQYRAYKEIAGLLATRLADESTRFPRAVSLEERYTTVLPEVVLGIGPEEFARLAAKVLTPKPPPVVGTTHLHQSTVSVRDEAVRVIDRLRHSGVTTFRSLTADCASTLHVVARFLALLDLFREGMVAFEQVAAFGELTVRWTGVDDEGDGRAAAVGAQFDEHDPVRGEWAT